MSQWNDLSRDRLIKEYRKYPCLWSNKDEDIKNAEKRKECLTLITSELNKYEQQKTFTQEEVRTQFKNLRDMYRRKRKKLQLQLETNVSVDEPGWVYFQRLKFLDDSIDFTLPSDSAHLPPPKKKGKTAANRSADDASLPTPLEENSNSPGSVFPCPTTEEQHTKAENQRTTNAVVEELVKKEMGEEEKEDKLMEQDDEEKHMDGGSSSRGATEVVTTERRRTDEGEDGATSNELLWTDNGKRSGRENADELPNNGTAASSSSASSPFYSLPRGGVAEICAQMPLNPSVLFPTTAPNPTSSSTGGNNSTLAVQQQQRRAVDPPAEEEDAEEFTCFGRFVAMTLRKIAALSPIDALEARKEISDVLYFYQKRSLSK